ncbi:MAG: hypothetical protein ACQESC_01355 [Nanobdellota archaeon]
MAQKKDDLGFDSFFDGGSDHTSSSKYSGDVSLFKKIFGKQKKSSKKSNSSQPVSSFYDTAESKQEDEIEQSMYGVNEKSSTSSSFHSLSNLFGFFWWELLILVFELVLLVFIVLYFSGVFIPF